MEKNKRLAGRPALKSGQRSRKIDVRFTEAEFAVILDLEKALGMSRTELIRSRVLENPGRLVINTKNLIPKLDVIGAELGRAGNNINQLARYANTLNKRGVLSPQLIERYNLVLRDYVASQLLLDKVLRKLVRALGK